MADYLLSLAFMLRDYEVIRDMSKKKRATVEEFVVTGNEVKHVPTNATFYAYEGGRQISRFLVGSMGSVLPNGDDYDVDSIKEIAAKLMRERPALKSQ